MVRIRPGEPLLLFLTSASGYLAAMDAVSQTSRLAEAGDPDALFQLATWSLTGEKGEVNLARARDLYRSAGEAGRFDGAIIYVNFLANGTGGASDWPRAVELLGRLAPHDPQCRQQLELIGKMTLTSNGDPVSVPEGCLRSERPHVVQVPGLFTEEECRFLIELSEPLVQPSVVESFAGQMMRDPGRSSDSIGFGWAIENPAVHALNRRIAAASGTKVDQGEPLQILRYRPGQEYRSHYDAIPGFTNQRALTFLVWLNEGYEGGETIFLNNNLKAKGPAGDGLLFRNADEQGERDNASAHAGLPVTGGEKWLASRWIRARRYEV
jgi:prolyl 4-hydroxylase